MTAGLASAMDAEGIQAIDVCSAFPTDDASSARLLKALSTRALQPADMRDSGSQSF
ncbi:hypothetical protein [Gordonia westfalica]|uniref:hypothetical protein n=1 Tax=Gordonia westfalica TaxID=158898 RepID=UPI001FCB5665|nr:hypothetical protein [Gordonia westfalica]